MGIKEFVGEYAFLSNFFNSAFVFGGKTWITVEHAFQALKTNDKNEQENIRKSPNPGMAKRMGRKVTLRTDWETVKNKIMYDLVKQKFEQNEILKEKLLDTKDEYLEEGNYWHDKYWGVCNCDKCQGIGKNELGKILMTIREELKKRRNMV